ncbi:hypothetical protein DRJ48_02240 [Candidatus Woesearchaeota archaeon]|nr:Lrp/AsnC family transcriptional regulator [Candidatus Woesearchaeota archaeon]RLE42963.1 MAG: hypothetical protein DRJ48_02240 [Candidatus Woesearchaeota archaeon]
MELKGVDYEIIAHLRKDARKPVPLISKDVGIPCSTIYEKIKRQYRGIFKRHTTLLNFHELGYHSTVHFAISCKNGTREELRRFLMEHPNINTLHRVNFGWDFVAEAVFHNLGEAEDFKQLLVERFNPTHIESFNVVEELKRESFLTHPSHVQ